MTVLELIEELEELDKLDMIVLSKNRRCKIYTGEEIDFIDEETLNLQVNDYGIRAQNSKESKYRIVSIEC